MSSRQAAENMGFHCLPQMQKLLIIGPGKLASRSSVSVFAGLVGQRCSIT